MIVITDVCLCQYTSHGHCGVLRDGVVDNDLSLELLAETAVSHAFAGADMVAPSDMMDGRVAAIRAALDGDGLTDAAILAYSAKFASAFYGPFRDAAHSAPSEGDRRGYQMDPANGNEAVREALLDIEEGADVVMVKPALPYLDVLQRLRARDARAARRLPGERRVRDDRGRRRARAGRPAGGGARVAHGRSAAPAPTSSSRITPPRRPGGFGSVDGDVGAAVRGGLPGDAGRRLEPGAGDALGRPRPPAVPRPRRGRLGVGRRRQPLRRLGAVVGAADRGPCAPRGGGRGRGRRRAGNDASARPPSSSSSSPRRCVPRCPRSSRCGSSRRAPRR